MSSLDQAGYELAAIALTAEQCDHIVQSVPSVGPGKGGVRNLIAHPTIVRMLLHRTFGEYLWSVIGRELVAVRATLFDKTPAGNWRVQWHQDRAVAVKDRLDVHGYGPWSSKAGVVHVEPPAEVLAQVVAARIHLDPCGPDSGPLRVIPGSHQAGKLTAAELAQMASKPFDELVAVRGAIYLMRPLLVHSSAPATNAMHRRVLHVEFAPPEAISPLRWDAAIPLRRVA